MSAIGRCIVEGCPYPSTSDADECFDHLEAWKAEQRRLHPRMAAPASLTIERVDGQREGWACVDCDPDDRDGPAVFLVGEYPELRPVCVWHRDEAIHDALPEGANCTNCGVTHAALWPTD